MAFGPLSARAIALATARAEWLLTLRTTPVRLRPLGKSHALPCITREAGFLLKVMSNF